MILIAIVTGTLLAGIGSVWLAALLSFGVLARYTQHMLSLAAGALLATAFMHLLPEAFESQVGAHDLFVTLLVGLVFFFLLDKAELWHHGHEHHHGHSPAHSHDHGADQKQGQMPEVRAALIGDPGQSSRPPAGQQQQLPANGPVDAGELDEGRPGGRRKGQQTASDGIREFSGA